MVDSDKSYTASSYTNSRYKPWERIPSEGQGLLGQQVLSDPVVGAQQMNLLKASMVQVRQLRAFAINPTAAMVLSVS